MVCVCDLQRSQVLGNKIEMQITELVEQNFTLLRLGLHLEYNDARHRVAAHLQRNLDRSKCPRPPPPTPWAMKKYRFPQPATFGSPETSNEELIAAVFLSIFLYFLPQSPKKEQRAGRPGAWLPEVSAV